MSFKVSNNFKWYETICSSLLIQLFQLGALINVKHTPKAPPNARGFRVAVVSIYISTISEIPQKVLEPIDRARAFQLVGRQNYTSRAALIPAACSYGASGFCLGSSGLQPWRQCHEQSCFCRGLGLAQNPTAPRISKRIKIEIKKDYEKIKKISVWSNTLWKEICN